MRSGGGEAAEAKRLAHYEVVAELARGGMAIVYEARHVHLGTRVAIKRMRSSLTETRDLTIRFRNEAIAAARVRHPNVLQVHDYGLDEAGLPYIVMELLEGESLASAIASDGRLPATRVADLSLLTLAGLCAIHAAGFAHRDLKPQNILLRKSSGDLPDPVILDFGVATAFQGAQSEADSWSLTDSGATLGTAAYMAPEQILSSKNARPEADQYALAVTMYECLTGSTPFGGGSRYETMHATLNARAPRPSDANPGVPPGLDAVVLRAMSRDPADRFPSAHAMGQALLPFASRAAALVWNADAVRGRGAWTGADSGSTAASSEPRRALPPPGRSARHPLLAAIALAATAAAATSTFLALHGTRRAMADSVYPPPSAVQARGATAPPDDPGPAPSSSVTTSGEVRAIVAAPTQPSRPGKPPAPATGVRSPVRLGTNKAPILE